MADYPKGFSRNSLQMAKEADISKSRLLAIATGKWNIREGRKAWVNGKMIEGQHYKRVIYPPGRGKGPTERLWFSDRLKIFRGRVWLDGEREEVKKQDGLFEQEAPIKSQRVVSECEDAGKPI